MPSYRDTDGRWRYRFAYRGKRYSGSTAKGFNTKRAADQLERAHLEKLQVGVYTGVVPTVAEFAPRFLDHQKTRIKPLSYRSQKAHVELHLVPHLGPLQLDRVMRAELDQLVSTWMQKGTAPRTVNTRLGTVLRMFGLAEEWRIIPVAPRIGGVKVPKEVPRWLSDKEQRQLLDFAAPHWRSMILIGLRTGLRIGELRGLQWADVDFGKRPLVHVRRTDPGTAASPATAPKGNRTRIVPLTAEAFDCLQGVLEHAKRKRGANWRPDDWIWPGVDAWQQQRNRRRTRSEGNCCTAIAAIADEAGITDCTWHTLRHTYASALVARGVSLRVVQDLLGHASIRQTEIYAHLAPNATHHSAVAGLDFALLDEAAEALAPHPEPFNQLLAGGTVGDEDGGGDGS